MSHIQVLDQSTIDKIAAGEVVDRPASIVKELVENAIDAGATAISAEIRDGGISLIRITDNGSGIPADEISLAFLRHSTSKIRDAADLSFLHTLGFRGEALSSIAAVSKTEVCTKTRDALTGIIYRINGGVEDSVSQAGLPDGTTMIVRELFYNTPARLKFLKSPQTEAGYVLDIIQRIALSRPDISFKYTVNGSVKMSTPGNGSLKDTIYAVFGRDITANVLQVEGSSETLQMEGFIGKPEIARGNRNFEFFFVNGRYIRDKILQKALEEAYLGYQMKGSFPFAVLNLRIEPELVDVNVHPSKMEIRFFNNETIFHAVYDLIRSRIVKRESIPQVSLRQEPAAKKIPAPAPTAEPFPQKERSEENTTGTEPGTSGDRDTSASENGSSARPKKSSYVPEPYERTSSGRVVQQDTPYQITGEPVRKLFEVIGVTGPSQETQSGQEDLPDSSAGKTSENAGEKVSYEQMKLSEPAFLSEEAMEKHRIIGEIFHTYWIVEYKDQLFIIDQHAAHEKVLYEKFMRRIKESREQGTIYSQQLMPSILVTLSVQEENTLQQYQKDLELMGFEIEPFGGREYAVSAVPADFSVMDHKLLLLELLDDLAEVPFRRDPEMITDRIATASCKAAVKGGNKLSLAEADALIKELLALDNPYNCPHGRPTIISMSRYELEKKFKRIV